MEQVTYVLKSTDPARPGYFAAEPDGDNSPFLFLDQNVLGQNVSQWNNLRHAQMAKLVMPSDLPPFQIKQIVITVEEFDV